MFRLPLATNFCGPARAAVERRDYDAARPSACSAPLAVLRLDKTFTVTRDGRTQTFDSFECAIHALAPTCAHCGCRVVGHGIEQGDSVYCCAHCARGAGVKGVADRA